MNQFRTFYKTDTIRYFYKTIHLLLFLPLLQSCSKDENNEIKVVEQIELTITDIQLTSFSASVTWDRTTNPNNLKPYIYYKKSLANEWTEVQTFQGKIENLESGSKYEAKAVMKENETAFESKITTFITPGFEQNGQLIGRVLEANSRYSINSNLTSTNFNEAATLSGYLKVVGFDSVPLKKIEVFDDLTLHIELPDETQNYFEDDINFTSKKEFTIGLFSGEDYTEISSSFIYSEDSIYEEGMRHFNIFNKTPRLNSLLSVNPQFSCQEMIRVVFEGSLWASEEDYFIFSELNIPNSVNIIFYDSDQNIVNAFSLNDEVQNIDGNKDLNDCTKEMWFYSQSLNVENVFTKNDRLNFNLFTDEFPSGTYFLKYMVNDKNDRIWESNTLEFQIE